MPSASHRPGNRYALVTGACFVVAVLGAMGAFNSYQVSKGYSAQFPDTYGVGKAQIRFAPLVSRIPENAQLGYITDLDPSQPAYAPAFLAAQYAVAPRLLVMTAAQTRPEWAVGNFSKPQDFAQVGEPRGYALAADLGNGVILFQRKSP